VAQSSEQWWRTLYGGEKITTTQDILGVHLTSPDKVLFPESGVTKRDLVDYYLAVAAPLLRQIRRRPLTTRTFPQGIASLGFYRKHAPADRPGWLETWRDTAESTGERVDFVVANDVRTIVWLVQQNTIELHPWLSTVDHPDQPDTAVFDLDPPDDAPFTLVAEAALVVKEALDQRRLRSWPKLTGSTGIHVVVPLKRTLSFDAVRTWVRELAGELVNLNPGILTTEQERASRGARVLIDYAQNSRGRNTVAAYSVRARPNAPVATPVSWDELATPGLRADTWTTRTLLARLKSVGDLAEAEPGSILD
jgi:bifunctional non-homologous end joining protein LigD